MIILFRRFRSIALILAVVSAQTLSAAYIPNVTVIDASPGWSKISSVPDYRGASNLVNNVGLFGDFVTTTAGGAMWLATNSPGFQPGQGFVVFDLGSTYTLDAIKVWNYNEGAAKMSRRCVKTADICYSTDNVNYSTNAGVNFSQAPGTFAAFPQTIPMGAVQARYVRINVVTNYSDAILGADVQVGLSKVRFIDNSVRPELLSAHRNYANNQVTLRFSEPIDPTSALNLANYSLQSSGGNSANIISASVGTYTNSVTLQTSPLTSGTYTLTASGVYDAAHVIPILSNSQVNVESELVLWLKADAGVTADPYGYVSQWNDQSGNGNNATQANNTAQPALFPAVVNGQPAVRFDGLASFMEVPPSPSLALNGDLAVYAVVSPEVTTVTHDIISKTGGKSPFSSAGYTNNMPAPFDLQLAKTSGKPVLVWGNEAGGAPATLTGSVGLSAGQYYLVSYLVRGTNATSYLNGNYTGSSTPFVIGAADAGNPLRLGIRSDAQAGAPKLQGSIAEVMLFRGTVSDADRVLIDNYLGPKYGIPVAPLTLTEVPASVTAQQGKSATFWVTAVAGSPTIYYQWKKNGATIAGATNAVYSTPTLTLLDSGASYTVTVSTPLGFSTNSPAATLSVVADTQAPTVSSAVRASANSAEITVTFSESVATSSSLIAANYSLNNGCTVTSVAAGSAPNQVVLTTSGLDPEVAYLLRVQKVQDLFSNTLLPATVPVLAPKLALWLKADAGVVTDAASLVTQWLDQSANTNNANQFIGSSFRPSLAAGAINGQPALRFNGISNFLQAASSPSLAITNDISLYVVANIFDLSLPRELLGKTLGNQPASYDYYVQSGANGMPLYRGNGQSGPGSVKAAQLPSTGVPHAMSVVMAGTNVSHFLDGKANGTGALSAVMADSGTALRIGSRDSLSQFMYGDMAEVLVFGGALSQAEREAIDNYVAVKYFPLTVTEQPASVSTVEGLTATFRIAASQGSAALRFQWQKNFIDIPGATNQVFTTPVLTQSDSATYQVAIIVPGWSTNYSAAATLTVAADTQPPTVTSAGRAVWSQSEIVVVFSEAITPTSGSNAANYSLDNGGVVVSAALGDAPNKVVLTTSTLGDATAYALTVRNVADLFQRTLVQTTVPVGLYPALALWLKADAGVTADASGWVSQWNDQSGFANHAIQPLGSTYSPMFVPAAVNGKPALRFDGLTSYLFANPSPSLALTGDMAIYAVVNFADFAANRQILGKTIANKAAPYDFYVWPNRVEFYRGDGAAYGFSRSYRMPTAGVPHVLGVNMQSTTVQQFLDGIPTATNIISTTIADNNDVLGIGSRNDMAHFMKGDIAEILLFSVALSESDRAALNGYLARKYDLMMGASPVLTAGFVGNNLRLSWPTPTANFVLQSAPDLSGSSWVDVPDLPSSADGTNTVNLSTGGTQQFFRLIHR